MGINNIRIKKLIGTIIIPVWLIIFMALISFLAELIIPDLNGFMIFLFYLISGVIWIVPLLPVITWMQKEN
jgi:uncharacterized membrane protein|tara:strand:+ start:4897 stop:5109 length:213 start_codon:yes stop_codon:yes gene_type:complete